jgi:Tetratricopeptide repeat
MVPSGFVSAGRRRAAASVLFLGAFAAGFAPNADGDLWWHMAAGRQIVRTRAPLFVDPFSVSAAGRTWIDAHWLFQIAAYAIHHFGGLAGLVLIKCMLVAGGALVLQDTVERQIGRRFSWVLVSAVLTTLFLTRHLLLIRPVIVTLVFIAIFFRVLERFRHVRAAQMLWSLPLLQIVWANVQGLFALGPALIAAYLLDEVVRAFGAERASVGPGVRVGGRVRVLAVTLLLAAVACCITPYGIHTLALPLKLLLRLTPMPTNVYAANVAENIPPMALDPSTSSEFWHLKWFLALLALSFFMAGRRLVLAHAILATGLVVLALAANRNVLLLYWLATPIAVINIGNAIRRSRRLATRLWTSRISFVAVVPALVFIGVALAHESSFAEAAPFRFPTQSARILSERPGGGAIFAADNYGGYLIWTLFPRYRPYIDTRLVLRTPEEFAEYLAVADHPERFDDFQKVHGFDYVILPTAYPDRYLDLVAHLYASSQWALVFTDGTETLFARRDRAAGEAWDLGSADTTSAILSALDRRFEGSPRVRAAARLHFAALNVAVGEYEKADGVLTTTSGSAADALRARIKMASGDLSGAASIGERILLRDANDVGSLNLMAMVSLRRGQGLDALHFLRRALNADPFDSEAERLLAKLEEHVQAQ